MLLDVPSPVLTVASDALRHLDGDHALESLWYLSTKCKGSLHDGPRLENISWRLWYRKLATTNSYRPLIPNAPLSEVTDEPYVLSQSAQIVLRQPTGQIIYEMLPRSSPNTLNSELRILVEKEVMNNVPSVTVLPTSAAELLSIPITPHDAYSSQGVPYINSIQSDNRINSRGDLLTSFFPRVVVVNPTPKPTPPTPPTTPVPISVLHGPATVLVAATDSTSLLSSQNVTGKLGLPPMQVLQPTSTPNSNMANDKTTSNPHSQTDACKLALSPEASSASEDKKSVSHPQQNPDTGLFSASHSVAISRIVGLAKSRTSTSRLWAMEPMNTPESLLPLPDPVPSSNFVASLHHRSINTNSTDQTSNRAHTVETISSTTVLSSGDNGASIEGNTSGFARGLPTSSDKSSTCPGRDASASSLAPKYYLSSANASPSLGSEDQSQSSFKFYLVDQDQNQNQSNAGPITQTHQPSQGAQQQAKRLFRVGNGDDDDEGWEDDDDSSSLSRSLSQSQSRSRSRSSRSRRMSSHSPPVLTSPNGAQQGRGDAIQHVQSEASTNGVSNQQLQVQQPVSRILDDKTQLTASPSSQGQTETQLEPRQTSAATISPNATVSPGTQHLTKAAPTDQIARQQSTKKEGVLGAIVGPNGRKIVVIATDEDDDDSDEDDDDWEETEEDDEDVDKKPNNEVPDTSRKSSARTETITAAPKVTEAPRKGSDAAPADSEPTEDDAGWTSASSADDEPSKDPEAGSTFQATVTIVQGTLTRGIGTKRLSNGTVTGNRHTNESLYSDKSKQKAQQPSPKGPRYCPDPPAPQVLQRAHSSKFVGPAGLGFTQQHQPNQPSRNPANRTKEHTQQPQQHPNPNPNPGHGRAPSARQSRRSVDMSEAALEAQRQLDLFAKKPKRAWSGSMRSGSGFLSQLMNPDPEIFPANHPYRRGYLSGDAAMPKGGATRLGIARLTPVGGEDGHHQLPGPIEVKKGSVSAAAPERNAVAPPRKGDPRIGTMRSQAPGFKPSKSAIALPVLDCVTVASVKDNGLVEDRIRNGRNRAGSGGYRPKARSHDQEMEDTDTKEENRMDMSKSAAQGKPEAILKQRKAAKQNQQRAQPFRQQPDSGRPSSRPDMSSRASMDILPTALSLSPPLQMRRLRSQDVPGATAIPTALMPLGYPCNAPPAAPPSSPRTKRQLMLRKEMSQSLRANLLWARQLTRAKAIGPRRRSSANVSGQWDNPNGNGNGLHYLPIVEPVGGNGAAPFTVSRFPTLVQLNPKKQPGPGQMVDAVGVGWPSIQDAEWVPKRKSSAAVAGVSRSDPGDGESIHCGQRVTDYGRNDKQGTYPHALDPNRRVIALANVGILPGVVQLNAKKQGDDTGVDVTGVRAYCEGCSRILAGEGPSQDLSDTYSSSAIGFGDCYPYGVERTFAGMSFCFDCNRNLRPVPAKSTRLTTSSIGEVSGSPVHSGVSSFTTADDIMKDDIEVADISFHKADARDKSHDHKPTSTIMGHEGSTKCQSSVDTAGCRGFSNIYVRESNAVERVHKVPIVASILPQFLSPSNQILRHERRSNSCLCGVFASMARLREGGIGRTFTSSAAVAHMEQDPPTPYPPFTRELPCAKYNRRSYADSNNLGDPCLQEASHYTFTCRRWIYLERRQILIGPKAVIRCAWLQFIINSNWIQGENGTIYTTSNGGDHTQTNNGSTIHGNDPIMQQQEYFTSESSQQEPSNSGSAVQISPVHYRADSAPLPLETIKGQSPPPPEPMIALPQGPPAHSATASHERVSHHCKFISTLIRRCM
ncbi:hypothetical protein VNI00_015360 [Paramarasmius palmivorus]|uniref:Nitrogen regulatory protein areA GATA-like domain-containing protein n=1 Tax=Paramarasmius palmivorus TaxID=297713 RepID=A0AAW0BMB3_9AGAR